MTIQLGENLKRLRRSRELTQEKLSELLGVSSQSISKWECGDNFPDITTLPVIANFFEVTLDELVGMSAIRDEKRIADTEAQIEALYMQENGVNVPDQVTALLKDLARELPYNFEVQMNYASHIAGFGGMGKPLERICELRREAIKIFERILVKCTDDSIRYKTIALLCEAYFNLTELDKAREYADKLPDIWVSRQFYQEQIALRAIYKYGNDNGYAENTLDDYKKTDRAVAEELIAPIKNALQEYLVRVQFGLSNYRFWMKHLGLASGEEYIKLIRLSFAWQELFALGNERNHAQTDSGYYYDIALEYVENGETDKALDAFDRVIDGYEHYPDEGKSFSVSQTIDDDGNVVAKRFTEPVREVLLRQYDDDRRLDPIRSHPRYLAALERLKNGVPYSPEDFMNIKELPDMNSLKILDDYPRH
ncbi:MAG: helix-turn-helix transcriptional regulator [Oscillospiraceae bacterium]|jgi:transcriptional regulator with XRE-family HTH domain|nr:helix-turn-helix transcriptional regulator [Oscillospiraceae bacterium]